MQWRALRSCICGRWGMEGRVEPWLGDASRRWAGLAARQAQAPVDLGLGVFWDGGCPRDHQMTAASQTPSSPRIPAIAPRRASQRRGHAEPIPRHHDAINTRQLLSNPPSSARQSHSCLTCRARTFLGICFCSNISEIPHARSTLMESLPFHKPQLSTS
jgi:hypothetical protein